MYLSYMYQKKTRKKARLYDVHLKFLDVYLTMGSEMIVCNPLHTIYRL